MENKGHKLNFIAEKIAGVVKEVDNLVKEAEAVVVRSKNYFGDKKGIETRLREIEDEK